MSNGKTATLAPPKPTPLSVVPSACSEIEDVVRQANLAQANVEAKFGEAFVMGWAIKRMRQLVTDEMMTDIMLLQGTSLGFRTDKDRDRGYPVNTVKDAMIEALLKGVKVTGNQFNIIANNCYITKEGYWQLVRDLEPLTELKLLIGVPRVMQVQEESRRAPWCRARAHGRWRASRTSWK